MRKQASTTVSNYSKRSLEHFRKNEKFEFDLTKINSLREKLGFDDATTLKDAFRL